MLTTSIPLCARACRAVEDKDKPYLYSIYVARATEFFGVTRTREIFEQAISVLPEKLLVLPSPSNFCNKIKPLPFNADN